MKYDLSYLSNNNILMLAHWDADGICSAVKFRLYINQSAVYYTPPIGSYVVPPEEFSLLDGYDYIVVLDMAVKDDNLGELAGATGSKIVVIDHHYHVSRENAIYIDLSMEDRGRFYSNTLLLDHLLNRDMDLLTILGLVGDLGLKIRGEEIYSRVSKTLDKLGFSLEEIYRIVLLLDSNHIINDRQAVREAVEKVMYYLDEPRSMLEDGEWINRYEKVVKEINRFSGDDGLEKSSRWIYKEFSSSYYIISRVGRRISSRYKGYVTIVVNTGFFPDHAQVYIRANSYPLDTYQLIEYALSRGYVAGGKDNVLGVVLHKNKLDRFVSLVKSFIDSGSL